MGRSESTQVISCSYLKDSNSKRSHLADLFLDIHETDLDQLVLPLVSTVNGLSKLAAALEDTGGPALGVLGLVVGPVVRQEASALSLELKVSTRGQVIKCLFEQLLVVTDASFQLTTVDKIKGFLVHPVIIKVVNFKEAVGWSPGSVIQARFTSRRLFLPVGLDRAQICPDDFGR